MAVVGPYSLSFTMATASSSSLKRVTVTTGPKISSRTMCMSRVTSVNKIGAN